MTSGISNRMANYWKNMESIKLGGCFKVRWVTTAGVPFNKISMMVNPYCDNELVRKSRDCTELDPLVGRDLCKLFELPFRDTSLPSPLPPYLSNLLIIPSD